MMQKILFEQKPSRLKIELQSILTSKIKISIQYEIQL